MSLTCGRRVSAPAGDVEHAGRRRRSMQRRLAVFEEGEPARVLEQRAVSRRPGSCRRRPSRARAASRSWPPRCWLVRTSSTADRVQPLELPKDRHQRLPRAARSPRRRRALELLLQQVARPPRYRSAERNVVAAARSSARAARGGSRRCRCGSPPVGPGSPGADARWPRSPRHGSPSACGRARARLAGSAVLRLADLADVLLDRSAAVVRDRRCPTSRSRDTRAS